MYIVFLMKHEILICAGVNNFDKFCNYYKNGKGITI